MNARGSCKLVSISSIMHGLRGSKDLSCMWSTNNIKTNSPRRKEAKGPSSISVLNSRMDNPQIIRQPVCAYLARADELWAVHTWYRATGTKNNSLNNKIGLLVYNSLILRCVYVCACMEAREAKRNDPNYILYPLWYELAVAMIAVAAIINFLKTGVSFYNSFLKVVVCFTQHLAWSKASYKYQHKHSS